MNEQPSSAGDGAALSVEPADHTRVDPTHFEASVGFLFRLAGWLGLATGLLEVALMFARWAVLGRPPGLGQDLVWMAPLVETALQVLVAAVCVLVLSRANGRGSSNVAVRVLLVIALVSVCLTVQWVHWLSMLLLGTGLGVQLSRLLLAHGRRVDQLTRRSLPWLTVTVPALTAALQFGWFRRPIAIDAVSTGAPNVVVVTLDTVTAEHMSLHGYNRPTTPFLERLAARSIVFDRAVSAASWTLPSHASMFTGRNVEELSTDWRRPLDDTYPTLAEWLGSRGYRTGGFIANTLFCTYEFGLDRGFQHFEDFDHSAGQFFMSSAIGRVLATKTLPRSWLGWYDVPGRKKASNINDAFLAWLPDDTTRPFFAWLNYFDAHEPYLPPEPYRKQFDAGHARHLELTSQYVGSAERTSKWEMSPDEVQGEIDAYDASIAYLDAQLERLVVELEHRELLDHTVLIITADHGEQFGEHGVFTHGNSLYFPVIHVPLLVMLPKGLPRGLTDQSLSQPVAARHVREAVSLRNLAATVADLAFGGERDAFPGTSLRSTWSQPATPESAPASILTAVADAPSWYHVATASASSVIRDHYHYIHWTDGQEELFDLDVDPWETHNLAGRRQAEEIRARFEATSVTDR